ncbi:hypothetical protein C8F04DRAFT_1280637 [Mycena alexandri]|uniref:Uncharacterized protein n=1 Tax=Mycena alexandri TaxID=1745969 RepID=A0AAD6WLE7_9AGAR|nr:hypothetical protein C8F04DRAFT_1280637 [Mycena alexandri]
MPSRDATCTGDDPPATQQFLASPEEHMLFGFDDYPPYVPGTTTLAGCPKKWTSSLSLVSRRFPQFTSTAFDSDGPFQEDSKSSQGLYMHNWFSRETSSDNNTSPLPSPSSPQSPSFIPFGEHSSPFAHPSSPFSPASLAAAIALPSSGSPSSSSFEDLHYAAGPAPRHIESLSVSPHETQTPAWAAQHWETTPRHMRTPSSPRYSPLAVPAAPFPHSATSRIPTRPRSRSPRTLCSRRVQTRYGRGERGECEGMHRERAKHGDPFRRCVHPTHTRSVPYTTPVPVPRPSSARRAANTRAALRRRGRGVPFPFPRARAPRPAAAAIEIAGAIAAAALARAFAKPQTA